MRLEDHFEVGGCLDAQDADVALTCLRCTGWSVWIKISTDEDGPAVTLADLIAKAEEHAETGCPATLRGASC